MGVSRSCREFIELYKDAKVNCPNCKYWDGNKCREEERVVAAHEREFDALDRMMRDAKDIRID